jgi:uncharacterized MAPEG superfamily protein
MTTELRLLAYAVVLLVVLIFVQASASFKAQDRKVIAGNRDDMAAPSAWEGRTRRALYNHIEGMAMFAPLALIAAVAGISNDMTVWAARLFFYARVAHAIFYLIGIPPARSLSFMVSVVGIVMMFLAIFGIIG